MNTNGNENNITKGTVTVDEEYFIFGNYRIKITEHFPEKGRTIDELIEELILYKAKKLQ